MSPEPLLPCPFCGAEPLRFEKVEDWLMCSRRDCFLSKKGWLTEEEWQRRAGLSPIVRTEIERVRDEIADNFASANYGQGRASVALTNLQSWIAALDRVLASTKEGK